MTGSTNSAAKIDQRFQPDSNRWPPACSAAVLPAAIAGLASQATRPIYPRAGANRSPPCSLTSEAAQFATRRRSGGRRWSSAGVFDRPRQPAVPPQSSCQFRAAAAFSPAFSPDFVSWPIAEFMSTADHHDRRPHPPPPARFSFARLHIPLHPAQRRSRSGALVMTWFRPPPSLLRPRPSLRGRSPTC